MIGKDWYFIMGDLDELDGVTWFNIVRKDLWDDEGIIDDNHIGDQIPELEENGFFEEMESTFTSMIGFEETREWLINNGFTETKLA